MSNAGIKGCRRFIERYWNLQSILVDGEAIRPEMENSFHKAIKKVSYDIENLKFNTAIASLMALMNVLRKRAPSIKQSSPSSRCSSTRLHRM